MGGYQIAGEKDYYYFDPWSDVCLNCNLPECYQDHYKDIDNKYERIRKNKKYQKELCPIEIARKMGWKPNEVLMQLKESNGAQPQEKGLC